MRIRWRGLELPSEVALDESVSTEAYGRFVIQPFERGFGTTIGNALRRILLSSLEGAAVSSVKIAGASHEFMSLPGVLEDVTNIILNIKGLIVCLAVDEPKTMTVSRRGKGEIRARDIVADAAIDIVNRDHLIATLTDDVSMEIEMTVRKGRGYAAADENALPESEIGVIPVDSVFSPVIRVRYRTEDTRVVQKTNYDRLILEVWTNGTIAPEDALVEASKILRKHLNPFVQYHDLGSEVVQCAAPVQIELSQVSSEMEKLLSRPTSDLELSVRANNCLESAKIETIGELAQKTEADLLRVRSFGKTSLREVRRKLADLGLSLGMIFEERGHGPGRPSAQSTTFVPPHTSGSDGGQASALGGGADPTRVSVSVDPQ